MSAFFKDIFPQNFKVCKSAFMKYVIFVSQIICFYSLSFFNDNGQLLYHNVAVYVSVQSEEEYSLTWKAKPLTIQTDKGKYKKTSQKR